MSGSRRAQPQGPAPRGARVVRSRQRFVSSKGQFLSPAAVHTYRKHNRKRMASPIHFYLTKGGAEPSSPSSLKPTPSPDGDEGYSSLQDTPCSGDEDLTTAAIALEPKQGTALLGRPACSPSSQDERTARRRKYEDDERQAGREPDPRVAGSLEAGEDLYPNCHMDIWMRTCREEVEQPIGGLVSGALPTWLKGTLLRNGPGSLECGDDKYEHLFDGSALIQRYCICDGEVTYQCRFLRTQTWMKNSAAKRIVVTEFGTKAVPDPCQTIFKRVTAMFRPGESISDNAMVSIYPIGDEFYAFTEGPVITRIDPITLETLGRVNVASYLGIVNHSSHPIVLEDGSVVNLGMGLCSKGPQYNLIHFPPKPRDTSGLDVPSPAQSGALCGAVPARWPLHPGYMHSFGCTASYWVLVEQPLCVSVPALVRVQLRGEPLAGTLRWFPEQKTLIHLISRRTGRLAHTFQSGSLFFLHVINCFERLCSTATAGDPGHAVEEVVVDVCCYNNPDVINCMYISALKDAQKNPDYARLFRSRPKRFVLPLPRPHQEPQAAACGSSTSTASVSSIPSSTNTPTSVSAQLLCDVGCETPRTHPSLTGRPYRYFYAISSDVDSANPGALIKVDTWTRTCVKWSEPGLYPSEPIFVPRPGSTSEDDGVVVCALVWASDAQRAGLLVLNAVSWLELGRAEFQTPSEVPKCLHGWFEAALV